MASSLGSAAAVPRIQRAESRAQPRAAIVRRWWLLSLVVVALAVLAFGPWRCSAGDCTSPCVLEVAALLRRLAGSVWSPGLVALLGCWRPRGRRRAQPVRGRHVCAALGAFGALVPGAASSGTPPLLGIQCHSADRPPVSLVTGGADGCAQPRRRPLPPRKRVAALRARLRPSSLGGAPCRSGTRSATALRVDSTVLLPGDLSLSEVVWVKLVEVPVLRGRFNLVAAECPAEEEPACSPPCGVQREAPVVAG